MTLGEVIILAVTQGVTEFLPVSSSGHLVLVRDLFGIPDVDGGALDAFLHLGTLLALLLYYWKVWAGMTRAIFVGDEEGKDKRELAAKLAIATIPGAVAGYVGQDIVEGFMRGPIWLAAGLFVTAALLVMTDMWSKKEATISRASFKDAALVGLAQVAALVPSISRSGVTIAAGRARGLSRKQAATFSFLMSAPIIAGAGLFSLSSLLEAHSFSAMMLSIGFLVSFISGWLAISLFMKFVENISLRPFAVYLVAVALFILWRLA